jgi:hypothetical protein
MKTKHSSELTKTIMKGLEESFEKLVEEKIKNNEKFAFIRDGKVVLVDPIEFKKEKIES